MRGSKRERAPGVWTLRVDGAPDPITRERKQINTTYHGTKKGAAEALARLVYECGGKESKRQFTTTNDLFELWINAPTRGGRARAESAKYADTRRYWNHVAPRIGEKDVRSISSEELTDLYDDLAKHPQHKSQKPLSRASVLNIHRLLSSMFEWGLRRGKTDQNPARKADVPSPVSGMPWAPERPAVLALLTYLQTNDYETWIAVRIGATVGARRSEIVGLRWRHLDLETELPTIHIEEGFNFVPGVGAITTNTKTGPEGNVRIPIDKELTKALRELRTTTQQNAEAAGATFSDDWYLFAADGLGQRPWHPDTFSHRVSRARENVPEASNVTLKSLRAFAASEIRSSGADITTAQALLRHKSPLTTMKYYLAPREERLREAAEYLGNSLMISELDDAHVPPST